MHYLAPPRNGEGRTGRSGFVRSGRRPMPAARLLAPNVGRRRRISDSASRSSSSQCAVEMLLMRRAPSASSRFKAAVRHVSRSFGLANRAQQKSRMRRGASRRLDDALSVCRARTEDSWKSHVRRTKRVPVGTSHRDPSARSGSVRPSDETFAGRRGAIPHRLALRRARITRLAQDACRSG